MMQPLIIQGGMGIGVSNWRLAKAVSMYGQLGVVSGTALDTVLIRRLQDGDVGGHIRRAIEHFPIPQVSKDVLRRYFLPEGRSKGQPYKLLPMYKQVVSVARQQVTMLANFVEVFLAKEHHSGVVGINLLTKVQLPTLASLYGAMLAGVDYVLMGAGIPREIPEVLDAFADNKPARIKFDITGSTDGHELITFDPIEHGANKSAPLTRPSFVPIVSAASLAVNLARKTTGRIDGFVVESSIAGGHNAPPRGKGELNSRGEPVYTARDVADLGAMRELGLPFWLAGGVGSPHGVRSAVYEGATGVQVGTLFAYCDESGFTTEIKRDILLRAVRHELDVFTDPRASPTGYPFKIVRWPGNEGTNTERVRICDLGYLRSAFYDSNGKVRYRCPAEPQDDYVKKGGELADTVGRQCLCNGLTANIGHPQQRQDGSEGALITSGDRLTELYTFLGKRTSYTAREVLDYLLPQSH